MKIIFLGTGPSLGVPVPTCQCHTCTSKDSKDKRLRSSVYIEYKDKRFVIDCGPDFRQQVLVNNVEHIDFILLTHKHNDHVGGMDDVRPFNYIQKENMPIYGCRETLKDVKNRFYYSFEKRHYPGAPKFDLLEVEKGRRVDMGDISIMPIEVLHGTMPILGYRIGDFTYITDAKYIEADQIELVLGTKYLVVNSLLYNRTHSIHFNLEEALDFIELINPDKAFLTHISHKFPPMKEMKGLLPKNVQLAYDGLEFSF